MKLLRLALLLALTQGALALAHAQTTTFTYQGYLTESGAAADGAFDFELALYNVDTGGSAIDVNAFDDVTVTGGLFELAADFTGAPFEAGGSYWVEARVRDGASTGAYTPLLPRQAVNASPYAIAAQAVIAPLDVAGDANVQGALSVGGDVTTPGEVRAGRVEADEVFSDGPVDFTGGVAIQRFGDNVALVVGNDGPTQPAARVVGDVELDGELRCTDGCIASPALSFPVLADRGRIVSETESRSVGAGLTSEIAASCPSAAHIPVFGDCPSGVQPDVTAAATEWVDLSDTGSAVGFSCVYENSSGVPSTVSARIYCLPPLP